MSAAFTFGDGDLVAAKASEDRSEAAKGTKGARKGASVTACEDGGNGESAREKHSE